MHSDCWILDSRSFLTVDTVQLNFSNLIGQALQACIIGNVKFSVAAIPDKMQAEAEDPEVDSLLGGAPASGTSVSPAGEDEVSIAPRWESPILTES